MQNPSVDERSQDRPLAIARLCPRVEPRKRQAFLGYGLNYLIDIENAVIVDVEATPARTYDEVAATMLDRAEERFDLKPEKSTSRRS